ncbi:MAG TPA: hypothetical protein VMO78_18470 [Rhizomicrobium sp.]|nr:hypothetical protein [Rhizomicrobium sp.]
MEKIGPDQLALRFAEPGMVGERHLHLVGARLEYRQQVAMPSLEILQNVCQLIGGYLGIQGEDTVDDMVCPGPVGGIEIARFHGGLEWPHDYSGRVGPQI